MASLVGWFGLAVGLIVSVTGMVRVLQYSPLLGSSSEMELVFMWSIVFLFGVMFTGWGIAKLVTQ